MLTVNNPIQSPLKGGTSYIPAVTTESETLINAMSPRPGRARMNLVDFTLSAHKAAGIYAKRDAFWLIAAHSEQAGSLNWKNPSTYTLTPVNTPTFDVDRGYSGDASTSYVDTGFASTASDQFTQNANNQMMWTDSDLTTSLFGFGGGGERYGIAPRSTSDKIRYYSSNGSIVDTTNTVTTSKGMTSVNRSAGNAVQIYRDNVQFETSTAGAFSQNSVTMKLGATSTTPTTTHRFNAAAFGGSLTQAESLSEFNIFSNYLKRVGVTF